MKKTIALGILTSLLLLFSSCISIDLLGLVVSGDVDRRFEDSLLLPEKAPVTISGTNFSFLVFSDPHVYRGVHGKLDLLKEELLPQDELIIVCGDIAQCGYEEDYRAFAHYLEETGLPYYPAVGNHDLYYGGWANYKKVLGKSCYAFTAGHTQFICFDSANGTLGQKQKEWLEETLAASNPDVRFVFTHYEFFSPGIGSLQQYTDIEEIYYLMNLFENHKVDYVFMGHSHAYSHKEVNGVNYVNLPDFRDGPQDKDYIRVFVTGTDVEFEKLKL